MDLRRHTAEDRSMIRIAVCRSIVKITRGVRPSATVSRRPRSGNQPLQVRTFCVPQAIRASAVEKHHQRHRTTLRTNRRKHSPSGQSQHQNSFRNAARHFPLPIIGNSSHLLRRNEQISVTVIVRKFDGPSPRATCATSKQPKSKAPHAQRSRQAACTSHPPTESARRPSVCPPRTTAHRQRNCMSSTPPANIGRKASAPTSPFVPSRCPSPHRAPPGAASRGPLSERRNSRCR